MSSPVDGHVLVGFICPICKTNLDSSQSLLEHYATHEAGESQPVTARRFDLRDSLKKIFDKAIELQTTSFERVFGSETSENRRPVTISEAELRSKDLLELFTGKKDEEKVKLTSRSHTDHLFQMRLDKIKNQGKETKRILKNLRKYLYEKPNKSLWNKAINDNNTETEAKECSVCKKQFKMFRRKRHCKLCDIALCDTCSLYVDASAVESVLNKTEDVPVQTPLKKSIKPLRHCEDCGLHLQVLKARSTEDGTFLKLIDTYQEMHNLKRQLSQTVVSYKELHESLVKGKNIHDLTQATIVKDHILQRGREIALLGKHIAEIPAEKESRQARLQAIIQKATDDFFKELLALPKVPTQEAIEEAKLRRFSDYNVRSRQNLGLQWDEN